MEKLDAIDLLIIDKIQARGRIKRSELAELVGLTTPAVSERLRKLEEAQIIKHYATVVNARMLKLDMMAFIFIATESSKNYQNVIDQAKKEPEIQECHAITGRGSHILKVRTVNTESLEKLLSRIQSWKGVISTTTDVVLSSPKETTQVPLIHLKNRE